MAHQLTTTGGWASVVLAAGQGTRMRSQTPKPLHPLGGQPLVLYPLRAIEKAGLGPPIVVRDPSPALLEALGHSYTYVVQERPNGTGGALQPALDALDPETRHLLVVNGDVPFVSEESLRRLVETHVERDAALTLLMAQGAPSSDLGRVIRDAEGAVVRIIEASDPEFDRAEPTANVGAYCIEAPWLRSVLSSLPRHSNDELYVTDLVPLARAGGRRVEGVTAEDSWEAMGINTRVDLAHAEQELRRRVLESLMLSGVTVRDPATTYVDATASIGRDTVLHPNTHIRGETRISEECEIGPDAQIADSQIGSRCRVWSSVLEDVTLEDGVDVGPYSRLRPGAYLSQGVHLGSFGEVKASRLGRDVAMGHFGYVGDAEIGDGVNIGAGTVTCNFDGVDKHRTVVEEGAFIGSDTMLVAPVRVGARSRTGAGSVVTRDVPPDTQVAGVPARRLPHGEQGSRQSQR